MTNTATCRHGTPWGSDCPDCDLDRAREDERKYGPTVDNARKVIAAAEAEMDEGVRT